MMKKIKFALLPVALIFIGVTYSGAYFSDSIGISGMNFSTGVWNPGRATISEVFYNPIGTDTGLEWIEIHNTGGSDLPMSGYVLHFDGVGTHDFTFPTSPPFSLASGARVVVHVRATGTNTSTDLYWSDTNSLNMGNSHGSVVLFKSLPKDSSTIIDFVQYGAAGQDEESKAVAAAIWTNSTFVPIITTEGHSMELISADNNQVSDWHDQFPPTQGS